MQIRPRSLVVAVLFSSGSVWAQTAAPIAVAPTATPTTTTTVIAVPVTTTPIPPTLAFDPPTAAGETRVALDVNFGIRFVPASRVTVPVGEALTITAPVLSGTSTGLQWRKNGRALPGATSTTLTLSPVAATDAGTYDAMYLDPLALAGRGTQALILGVGPTDRLLNLSARGAVGPAADQTLTAGFVVAATTSAKKIIVRAIGPTLAQFGVANPLRAPALRIYDGNGAPYTNDYVYAAVVGGLTYETDLAASLARTGAFPITTGTRDVTVMKPFTPGNYTAVVSSGDGTAGTALLEIYEVP